MARGQLSPQGMAGSIVKYGLLVGAARTQHDSVVVSNFVNVAN